MIRAELCGAMTMSNMLASEERKILLVSQRLAVRFAPFFIQKKALAKNRNDIAKMNVSFISSKPPMRKVIMK